jgi:hypoxanthine phosphoribosyltransferase
MGVDREESFPGWDQIEHRCKELGGEIYLVQRLLEVFVLSARGGLLRLRRTPAMVLLAAFLGTLAV